MISPTEFSERARGFLDANATRRSLKVGVWGEGSDAIDVISEDSPEAERLSLDRVRAWRRKVYDAGFGWPSGPAKYGGLDLPIEYDSIYRKIETEYDVPDQSDLLGGISIIGPSVLEYARDPAREKYLAAIYRGDVVACQLFSEPNAGSDLASLRTRAIREGEWWEVSGQKVWTSGARVSDVGLLFARTSLEKPRHHGVSVFLVDMSLPGVTVRPIRQMTGGAHFNEVFLDGVRISDEMRMGPVDEGWPIILRTLRGERAAVGVGTGSHSDDPLGRLLQLARHQGATENPVIRDRLADIVIRERVLGMTANRLAYLQERGTLKGPEAAMTKLMFATNHRRIADLSAEILGPAITADTNRWGTFAWSRFVLGAPALRIAGGTDEIMRNTLAEQVLGLPRDKRPAS
jgi:alkylation response protein AidB-like acyl-CoA dehydrogenase